MHMRTTINIDDDLLARAEELTGIHEKPHWCERGLKH
jgi:Arc/MetJ family transcription regulator